MKSDTYTRHLCEGRHTFIRTGEQKIGSDVLECVYCSMKAVDVAHPVPAPKSYSIFIRAILFASFFGLCIGAVLAIIIRG